MGCLWRHDRNGVLPSGSKTCVHLVFIQSWEHLTAVWCYLWNGFGPWADVSGQLFTTQNASSKEALMGRVLTSLQARQEWAGPPVTIPTQAWLSAEGGGPAGHGAFTTARDFGSQGFLQTASRRVFKTCFMYTYACVCTGRTFSKWPTNQRPPSCHHPNSVQNFLHNFAFRAVFVNNLYKSYL